MDSESQISQNFDLSTETLSINRIILLPDALAAETFLREIFPLFCNCLVVSADGEYPKNKAAREMALEEMQKNPKLVLVIFNLSSLKSISLASDRFLLMDDLIMQDFKKSNSERWSRLNNTPHQIVFIMESFFRQWEKVQRIGNPGFIYHNSAEYMIEDFDWRHALLGRKPEDPPK